MAKSTKTIITEHKQVVWVGVLVLKKEMRLRLWKIPEVYKNDYRKFKKYQITKS